jgi:hypothetical protein
VIEMRTVACCLALKRERIEALADRLAPAQYESIAIGLIHS